MTRRLTLGFSPCPNDTFLFHALVHGLVDAGECAFDVVLDDVEALNARAADPARRLAITKLSLPAFAALEDVYELSPSGSALGHGVGPLVVARRERSSELADLRDLAGRTIAVPGVRTTAFALLRRYGPRDVTPVPMRFDAIMPAIVAGEVDAGVVIHESRFTYAAHGLHCVADLGERWESDTRLPLPLGVIAFDRSLTAATRVRLGAAIGASARFARANPAASRAYVAAHANEMAPDVCAAHIALYVNDQTVALDDDGRRAVATMVDYCRRSAR